MISGAETRGEGVLFRVLLLYGAYNLFHNLATKMGVFIWHLDPYPQDRITTVFSVWTRYLVGTAHPHRILEAVSMPRYVLDVTQISDSP